MQTAPRRAHVAWFAVSGLYAVLTLIYAWPLLPVMDTRLPSDLGDPGLNTWILWWNAHALPLTDRWWNAPIFFPVQGAFALSETLLSIVPLTTPLQWLGASPVTAYNVVFLLSFFSAALAAHALAFQLTGRHAAALVAGVAYGFNPYRAAQLPHLQMLLSCWMPLALLALHRYIGGRRRRDLVLFGAAWLLNALTTGYFLVFFAVLFGLWMLWFVRTRRDALAILVTAILASLPLAPLLAGYTRHHQALDVSRGLGEIVAFSADLSAIWATSPFVWLPHLWTLEPRPEGELYPGIVVLGLVLTGAYVALRNRARMRPSRAAESPLRRRARRVLLTAGLLVAGIGVLSWLAGGWTVSLGGVSISVRRPYKTFTSVAYLLGLAGLLHPRLTQARRNGSPALFYGATACVMFVFALGPLPHAFDVPILYQAPYAVLMAFPGGDALRVPARFAMPLALCLSQAAAMVLWRLSGSRPRAAITALLVAGIALDGWIPKLKTDLVPHMPDLSGLEASLPVLELPMGEIFTDTAAMLRATGHGHPLINGFSGYQPSHYPALQQAMRKRDPDALDALTDKTPLIVVVDPAKDVDGRLRQFVAGMPRATLIRETDAGVVFLLPGPH